MSRLRTSSTVLVGWDGATFSVLEPLMRDGTMPFLARFAAEGARGVLHSTVHPLTPAAWTSLMTGVSPGEHGVFDFVKVDRREDRYTYVLSTSGDVRSETVWSIAGRHGCRVTCLNFPSMFPPPPIPGFVVPGFVPWQYLPRAIQPSSLYPRIRALPGFEARALALDWDLERKALQGLPEEQYESWIRFHTLREQHWFEILRMLMCEDPCQLTAVLFDGVDKLQHLCYHLLDPRQNERFDSPWADNIRRQCREYFRQLDEFLESVTTLAGSDARIFIASDHGFTSAGNDIFYANVWLEQNGYLRWADGVPLDQDRRLTLDGHSGSDTMFDWTATKAFALTASSNGIYIRKAEKPGPGVPESEYESFRTGLADALLALTDSSGEPVLQEVLFREQAFPGKRMLDAPDLVLVLRDRSFLSVLRADAPLKSRVAPYGTHHPEGVFLARGPGIRAGAEIPAAPIVSVAPTLLYSLGIPIPEDMEGKVNVGAFERSFVAANPVCKEARTEVHEGAAAASAAQYQPAALLTREMGEEEAVIERLKALGYLE
jgi:predicted AlkP superfamily phosphohydrolase/phosphomutase